MDREEHALKIVKNYMWWSMGAGLIPVPFVDLAAVTGIQLKMLSDISKCYDMEFSEHKGKSIIAALLGSVVPNQLSKGSLGSLLKMVPVVGPVLSGLSMSIFSGASGYALGKVFIQHYESGGTFLTFDPEKVRNYYKESFERGMEVAEKFEQGQSAQSEQAKI
ncbi:uncharacterized protein associated with GTPases [Sulfurospirillum barnesii SES-3]|uniref:Uncharacterized protein associated with GTPases n=1 Tax=Sulfurospirillum barnesii (strain ATCC 700032 / DSM 10660 / SES-3) TaxID=760154 RepID=I3XVS5_SULBS|nr:DUF697 domain-containing protein [Sulfurospirillum barnesii]AFL68049.1 uncharacterized protein associated with GTPases [Sulfurospirillum barnesii SES-3]